MRRTPLSRRRHHDVPSVPDGLASDNQEKDPTMNGDEVLSTFANMPAAMIGIEACAGSHYWVSKLNALGHDVNQRT